MEKKLIYTIIYWEGEKEIDRIRIQELNAELIWRAFKDLGHSRTTNTSFEVHETFED
jgi:hypothetical protein